jgi:hypothetical protein
MKRLSGTCSAVLICCALVTGCGASTEYVPIRKGHTYLVLKDGQPAYYKDGQTALIYTTDEADKLLACDAASLSELESAQSQMGTAQAMLIIGSALGIVGAFIFAPIADGYIDRAGAATIDALNAHNESPECAQHPPVAQSSNRGQR